MCAEFITIPMTTDPDDLAQEAYDFLESVVPGFDPHAGNIETWLIAAIARIVAVLMDLSTDVPPAIFRYLGQKIFSIQPIEDVPASGTVTFTMVDAAGYTVPAGTNVAIADAGDTEYGFVTVADLVIPPTATTGDVGIVASVPGAAANSLTAVPELRDSLAFVASIALIGETSSGTDAEDDDTYLNRLRGQLQLLTPRFVLARDAAALAQNVDGVFRAVAIDNYDTDHNLLTANQASFELGTIAGWAAGVNCSIAASSAFVADGAKSLELTSTASGDMTATTTTGTGGIVVHPGMEFTAILQAEAAASARSITAGIVWYNSGGSVISTSRGTPVTDSTSNFATQASVTATAPATAAYAAVEARVAATGGASEKHYIDKIALREGVSIAWKAGGSPATGVEKMIAVCPVDETGAAVSSGVKTTLEAFLEAMREINFKVHVIDPTFTTVPISWAGVCFDGFDTADVQTRGDAALAAFLDPASFGQSPFGDTRDWNLVTIVRYLEAAQALNSVEGLNYLTSLTINGVAADLQLYGVVPLPQAGAIVGVVSAP